MPPAYDVSMTTAAQVREDLAALEDPKIRAVNERHGDEHGVNLTRLRAVAKGAGHDAGLARELWASGDSAARLVAILVSRPKDFSAAELDARRRGRLATLVARAEQVLVTAAVAEDVPEQLEGARYDVMAGQVTRVR